MIMGRPTKYDPAETPGKAAQFARDGLTEDQIAGRLGIGRTTLFEWRQRYPDFANALKEQKAVIDSKVERSLFERAMGYEYEEEEVTALRDRKGESIARIKRTKKRVPPDVTAQIFWLKNRQPARWRDVQQQEHTGKDGRPIQVDHSSLTDEERADRMLALLDRARARRDRQVGKIQQPET